jgi:hypothetical protein
MKKVKLADIRIDGGTQMRVVIDQATVYDYVEAMKDGAVFPMVETTFDGATHWLTDGFHRYHAYKILNIKEVEVKATQGTLQDAIIAALFVNGRHGKPLTVEDKRNKVKVCLGIDKYKDATNYEIAKICCVSQPFVAAVRYPEIKEKQNQAKLKNAKKNAEKSEPNTNPISSLNTTPSENTDNGANPDDAEIRAAELALEADQEAMYKLLESDDPLKAAHEEIKRLNYQNAQLEIRITGLQNERNVAQQMVKDLQKQLDKIKGKK